MLCTACGVSMPDDAAFCPGCGRATATAASTPGTTRGINDNLLGVLAYFTFIPALIFLLVEPFNKNRFLRFHSFQSLFLFIAALLLGFCLKVFFFIVFMIPLLGHLLTWLLSFVVSLGWFILWLVLLVKAYQGEWFKLPVIGDIAEKQANLV